MFTIAIGDAQALAQLNNVAAQSLSHIELRSVDGQAVSFHAGDRYPVLTAGYFGQANVNAGTAPVNNGLPSAGAPTNNNPTGSLLNTARTFGNVANPTATAVADFNGDSIPDFAAASSSGSQVAVSLGIGNGTFGNATTYATGQNQFQYGFRAAWRRRRHL
jgi:hypothetical protein